MPRSRRAPLTLLLPLLLAACTGTEETLPPLRLAVLTEGGSALRLLTLSAVDSAAGGTVTADARVPVTEGVDVDALPSGRTFALTRAAGVEVRAGDGSLGAPFATPPFTPCLKAAVTSAARDRLLTFSGCPNDAGRLALYRADGTLIWTALLPLDLPPAATPDTPPLRLAVQGDVAVVARARLGGGSEVMRVAVQTPGDAEARVSDPRPTVAIRDLAPYGTQIVAATDAGLQPLTETGEPNPAGTLAAFGTGRYDRVWTGAGGARTLIAAWRDNRLSGNAWEPLRLWDGRLTTAATVTATAGGLRDLTFTPDGLLYTLSETTLTQFDTVSGLNGGTWKERRILSDLTGARALTWLVP